MLTTDFDLDALNAEEDLLDADAYADEAADAAEFERDLLADAAALADDGAWD